MPLEIMKPYSVKQPEDQHRRAVRRARRLGLSFGEYVRALIERDIKRAERTKRRAA
jgi:hypothetical protein